MWQLQPGYLGRGQAWSNAVFSLGSPFAELPTRASYVQPYGLESPIVASPSEYLWTYRPETADKTNLPKQILPYRMAACSESHVDWETRESHAHLQSEFTLSTTLSLEGQNLQNHADWLILPMWAGSSPVCCKVG